MRDLRRNKDFVNRSLTPFGSDTYQIPSRVLLDSEFLACQHLYGSSEPCRVSVPEVNGAIY